MKKCEKCNRTYENEMNFCINCGSPLVESTDKSKANKIPYLKVFIPLAIVVVIIVAVIAANISENKAIESSQNANESYRALKMLSEPSMSDLKIDSYTVSRSGSYTTIKGKVTNTSATKDISYYKIKAKYYSGTTMDDSDWTNGTDLGPGETQSFTIMTKGSWTKSDVTLSVEEVR